MDVAHNGVMDTIHVTQRIDRPADTVYEYTRHRDHLGAWAVGVSDDMHIEMAPENTFGVLDHWVTLDGTTFYNAMRVIPLDDASCEVVFTLRPFPGVDEAAYEKDHATITHDLATLKDLLEK